MVITVSEPRWPALATSRLSDAAARTKNPSPKITSCALEVLHVGCRVGVRRGQRGKSPSNQI